MTVTAEEFAAMINGNQYLSELTREQKKLAFQSRLMVFFGRSDDLLEVEGVGEEEYGAWNGADIQFTKTGAHVDLDWDGHEDAIAKGYTPPEPAFSLSVEWCPDGFDGSWLIVPDCKHASFIIKEDGDLYCQGCVVDLKQFEVQP